MWLIRPDHLLMMRRCRKKTTVYVAWPKAILQQNCVPLNFQWTILGSCQSHFCGTGVDRGLQSHPEEQFFNRLFWGKLLICGTFAANMALFVVETTQNINLMVIFCFPKKQIFSSREKMISYFVPPNQKKNFELEFPKIAGKGATSNSYISKNKSVC